VMIEKDSRILRHSNYLEPLRGLNVDADTELSQVIRVVDGGIADSMRALDAVAKLSAELNPPG
jgi:hypothetical protein